MDPTTIWLFILLVLAVIFFAAEMHIPSHGLLSLLAIGCLAGAVALCFVIDRWLGWGAMLAFIILGPIALSAGFSLWQRTPLARRLVLNTSAGTLDSPIVLIGSVGKTMTELRPMGMGEFADQRIEVRSEMEKIIPVGTAVQVIALDDRVAVVRPVDLTAKSTV